MQGSGRLVLGIQTKLEAQGFSPFCARSDGAGVTARNTVDRTNGVCACTFLDHACNRFGVSF
jgi:hypothetical protein